VLDPSRFEAAVERVAAPGSEDRVRRLFGRGIEDVRAMFADRPRVSRATPVGYRLLSFDGTRASVAIGGSSLMTPVAQQKVGGHRTAPQLFGVSKRYTCGPRPWP
jgi:hypothetical protein